jgi:hypothetical protein
LSIFDVRSFKAADCERERLAVNKQRSHGVHMERFDLKKLNKVEGKEQFCVEVSNRFAALEDLGAEVEINSAWETIRENINISAKESLGSIYIYIYIYIYILIDTRATGCITQ